MDQERNSKPMRGWSRIRSLRRGRAASRDGRVLLLAFLLIVVGTVVIWQSDLEPVVTTTRYPGLDPARTGTVVGRALDARSQPILGATFEFSTAPGRRVSSDAEGRFSSGPLPPESCVVTSRAPGCAISRPRSVLVTTGREIEMTVAFEDAALLEGVVTDTSGRRIPDAKITIQGEAVARQIDATGRFQFDDVRAGSARIVVEAPGFQSWTKHDLILPAVDLSIPLDSRWTIEGVVMDPVTGTPIEIEHLIVESCGEWSLPWLKTGERRFEFSSSSVAWLSQRSITGSSPNVTIGPDLEPIESAIRVPFERIHASQRSVILERGGRFRIHGQWPCLLLLIVQAANGERCVGGPFLRGSEGGDPSVRIEFRGGATLRVRGIDAVSQLPIAGALVWHGALVPETNSPALRRMVSTDADGIAVLREIHGNWTYVQVAHPEYLGQVVRVDCSVSNPTLEFVLKPIATDEQGDANR